VAGLAASAARQTATLQGVVRAAAEQASTTAEVTQAMRDLRARSRELSIMLGAKVRSASASAADAAPLASAPPGRAP
jgi:methyl-accepting chemotaxis protein